MPQQVQMPDGTVVEMPDNPDPALIARLNAFRASLAPPRGLSDTIPAPAGGDGVAHFADGTPYVPPEQTTAPVEDDSFGDPVIDMLAYSLPKAIKGAPETLATIINNGLVQGAAGLSAPFVAGNADDAANYIRDFEQQHLYTPQGDSARELTGALAEGFDLTAPKRALGESTLEATGSPLLAAGADTIPDAALAALGLKGGPAAVESGLEALGPRLPKPVNPVVEDLRAGGIELRPSDIRAMHPEAKSIPGEFREKFANPADLKKSQTLHNQATLTKRAADRFGTPDLTDQSLAAAEKPKIDVYRLAESVAGSKPPIPEFQAALDEATNAVKVDLPRGEPATVTRILSTLRDKARRFMKADNQEANNQGYAARNMAEALEEAFGKQLEAVGEPQVLKQYQEARQFLGELYDVWDSKRADQIDAAALRRLNEKAGGGRLKGDLKFIADASEYAPNVTGHSLKTASRSGEEFPATKEGMFTRATKALVRQIPGMDVGSRAFQDTLGTLNPVRSSYYGAPEFEPPARPAPQQGEMDLRSVLGLEPSPGEVAVPPPDEINLQEALGLGEPLDLKKSPGRVGKPKRKQ